MTHLETIQRYYRGCNTADQALMQSTFTDDVVHYFVDHAPVTGSAALARYWAKVGPRTRATWNVDHFMGVGDEAVIEWSMRWLPPDVVATEEADSGDLAGYERLRGTEWFRFRGGLICEVRSYHCNHRLAAPENRALHGFPYEERGYPLEP